MYFTSFETASLKRMQLVELPDGTFTHKDYTFVATCLATSYIDNKVITAFQLEHADIVYNFNNFPDFLQALRNIFKDNQ